MYDAGDASPTPTAPYLPALRQCDVFRFANWEQPISVPAPLSLTTCSGGSSFRLPSTPRSASSRYTYGARCRDMLPTGGIVAVGAAFGGRGGNKHRRCRYGNQRWAGAALGLDGAASELSPGRRGRWHRSFHEPIRRANGELARDLGQSDVNSRIAGASRPGHCGRNRRARYHRVGSLARPLPRRSADTEGRAELDAQDLDRETGSRSLLNERLESQLHD